MREIVVDLDGRRRALFEEARIRLAEAKQLIKRRKAEREPPTEAVDAAPEEIVADADQTAPEPSHAGVEKADPLLTPEERRETARWQNLARFQPPVVDFLKAQVLAMDGDPKAALERLEQVQQTHLARPGLFLQTAGLYMKLGRWSEAEQIYMKALEIDPDNPHAHLGMCRMHLRRRDYSVMADSALETLRRLYQYPLAHYYLGVALVGLQKYQRAATALQVAVSINPNFPQAHRLLTSVFARLGDGAAVVRHLKLYRETRRLGKAAVAGPSASAPAPAPRPSTATPKAAALASDPSADIGEGIVIVSGLPRSGTSMITQMLYAGGQPILTDELRRADDDNPLGYLEYEAVKRLHQDATWLKDSEGKAIKIVAPLLTFLPQEPPCHVVFIERSLEEILSSQGRMIGRQGPMAPEASGRRDRLQIEYERVVRASRAFLAKRPRTRVLYLDHAEVLARPDRAARDINRFLGDKLAVDAMVAAVDTSLHATGPDWGSREQSSRWNHCISAAQSLSVSSPTWTHRQLPHHPGYIGCSRPSRGSRVVVSNVDAANHSMDAPCGLSIHRWRGLRASVWHREGQKNLD